MGHSIQQLLEIGSAPIGDGTALVQFEATRVAPPLAAELASLLATRDGFFALESALQVYPVQSTGGVSGIADWNVRETWKGEYRGMADDLLCFAQDSFGNQFALCGGEVVLFECETGDRTVFAGSVEEWAANVLADYDFVTGHALARSWQLANRPLAPGERLLPVKPFTIGGEYEAGNLRAMDGAALLRFFGDFAVQLKDKPDGTAVRLTTGP